MSQDEEIFEKANEQIDELLEDDASEIKAGVNSYLGNNAEKDEGVSRRGFLQRAIKAGGAFGVGGVVAGWSTIEVLNAGKSFVVEKSKDPWELETTDILDRESVNLLQKFGADIPALTEIRGAHHNKALKVCADIILSWQGGDKHVEALNALGKIKQNHQPDNHREAHRFLSVLYARNAVPAGRVDWGISALEEASNYIESRDEVFPFIRQSLNHSFGAIRLADDNEISLFRSRLEGAVKLLGQEALIEPEKYSFDRVDEWERISSAGGVGIAVMESLYNCLASPPDTDLRNKLFDIQLYALDKFSKLDAQNGWYRYTPVAGLALNLGEIRIAEKVFSAFDSEIIQNADYQNTQNRHTEMFYPKLLKNIIRLRNGIMDLEDFRVFIHRSRMTYKEPFPSQVIKKYIAETSVENTSQHLFASRLGAFGTHGMYFPAPLY